MMKKQILLLAVALIIALGYGVNATNYYMKPNGSDAAAGTSIGAAWKTLGKAQFVLVAGDTLFVMGGAYASEQGIITMGSGTTLRPVVIKAYGDSIAAFQNSPNSRPRFIDIQGVINHLVIDGESYINPSSPTRFLKFTGECDNMAIIMRSVGFVMRGTEWDGTNSSLGANQCWMFMFIRADSFLIENNYMHDGGHAVCETPPDCTNDAQSSGDCLYLQGCSYGKIRDNIFRRGNHDLVMIQCLRWSPYTTSKYILIQNNIFDNGLGGCLYLTMGTSYCLVENNVMLHPGRTTTYPKPGMQISGDHNTIRKNVFYCPSDFAIVIQSAYDIVPGAATANYNYIYNNTFFSSQATHLQFLPRDNGYPQTSTENSLIANNIFYKVAGRNWYGTLSDAAIVPFMCQASNAHNWVTPDVYGSLPSSTSWGNNRFKNNLIRNDSRGLHRDSLVMFASSDALGMGYLQNGSLQNQGIGRLPRMQNLSIDTSGAWSGNIGGDPKLTSESPDVYGTNWWYLQPGSACIDSGIAVVDSNGIWMRANAAGYSWDDLSYIGSAPDIGAWESDTDSLYITKPDDHALAWGDWTIGSSPVYKNIRLINHTGETLIGTAWVVGNWFYLSSPDSVSIPYTIQADSIKQFTVVFRPTNRGSFNATVVMSHPFPPVGLSGTAIGGNISKPSPLRLVPPLIRMNKLSYNPHSAFSIEGQRVIVNDNDGTASVGCVKPVISSLSVTNTIGGDAYITWDTDSSTSHRWNMNGSQRSITWAGSGTSHSDTLVGPFPATHPWNWRLTVGNISDPAFQSDTTFVVANLCPEVVKSDFASQAITDTSATLHFHTDVPSHAVFMYHRTGNYPWVCVQDADADSTQHTVSISGLTSGYVYVWKSAAECAGCHSDEIPLCQIDLMSDSIQFTARCQTVTFSDKLACWDEGATENHFEIKPSIACKMRFRYKQTSPVPGGYTTGSWSSLDISCKTSIMTTTASTTYQVEYQWEDECGAVMPWTDAWETAGTWATNASNRFTTNCMCGGA